MIITGLNACRNKLIADGRRIGLRMIELAVTATDGTDEIGKGKHTRIIISTERFIAKARTRK